jgi:hypothetical protein
MKLINPCVGRWRRELNLALQKPPPCLFAIHIFIKFGCEADSWRRELIFSLQKQRHARMAVWRDATQSVLGEGKYIVAVIDRTHLADLTPIL